MATAAADGFVKVWDVDIWQPLVSLPTQGSSIRSLAFSPDCARLAAATRLGPIIVWDATPEDTTTRVRELRMLAGHHTLRGELHQAIVAYNTIITLSSGSAVLYSERGNLCSLVHNWEQAITDFSSAISLDPENANYLFSRADACVQIQEYAKALTDYAATIELWDKADTRYRSRYNRLAWRLVAGTEPLRTQENALQLAKKAAEIAGNKTTLGVVYYRLGNLDMAVQILHRESQNDEHSQGGNAFMNFFLAMSYHRLGEAESARQHYGRAVDWWMEGRPFDKWGITDNVEKELTSIRDEADTVLAGAPHQ